MFSFENFSVHLNKLMKSQVPEENLDRIVNELIYILNKYFVRSKSKMEE